MPRDFFITKLRIIRTMQNANRPLILQHVAKECGMTPQAVKYQLKQMVDWGIGGTILHPDNADKVYYTLQPAYYDKNWLNSLYALLTPYVQALGKMLDYDQAKMKPEEVLTKNLSMLLRLFEEEAEKIGKAEPNGP